MTNIEIKRLINLKLETKKITNASFFYFPSFLPKKNSCSGDFNEHRVYQLGDSARRINWTISSRMNSLWVKSTENTPPITVVIYVDLSASMIFTSQKYFKYSLSIELFTILGWVYLDRGFNIKCILIFDQSFYSFNTIKNTKNFIATLNKILTLSTFFEKSSCSDWNKLRLSQIDNKKKLTFNLEPVIIISDFIPLNDKLKQSIKNISNTNYLTVFRITDPWECGQLPEFFLSITDNNNNLCALNLQNKKIYNEFTDKTKVRSQKVKLWFQENNIPFYDFHTKKNILKQAYEKLQV